MPKVTKPKTSKPKKSKSKSKAKSGKSGKSGRCWAGYKPTPGKRPYSNGSCMKSK